MIKQTAAIFDIGLIFATGLVKAVKNDKSWEILD